MASDVVDEGLALLEDVHAEPVTAKTAIDLLSGVTTDPRAQREIVARGVRDGLVTRDAPGDPAASTTIGLDGKIKVRIGDFDCRRCGHSLSKGHFYVWDGGELGPFGPTCIKKVLGRDT